MIETSSSDSSCCLEVTVHVQNVPYMDIHRDTCVIRADLLRVDYSRLCTCKVIYLF